MKIISMNKDMGTKWFTFYTKIRPWFAYLSALITIYDCSIRSNLYFNNLFFFLYFLICAIGQPILFALISIKSEETYGDFIRIIKPALIFEVCFTAYQLCISQSSITNGRISPIVLVIITIVLLFWYKINLFYFKKRVITEDVESIDLEEAILEDTNEQEEIQDEECNINYCTKCGKELFCGDLYCSQCGTKIE